MEGLRKLSALQALAQRRANNTGYTQYIVRWTESGWSKNNGRTGGTKTRILQHPPKDAVVIFTAYVEPAVRAELLKWKNKRRNNVR